MTAIRANLPYRSFRCVGDDALTFLQGQVTQDISSITSGNCHYAAYCNHKAQMFANLLIYGDNNHYILRLHESQAEAVSKRLGMFLLRAQATIEALACEHIGLNRQAALLLCEQLDVTLPEVFASIPVGDGALCALPGDYFELSLFTDNNTERLAIDWSAIPENLDAIERLRLSSGHFHIFPTTSELILPQQTSLETWGGINYQKGCYVGQEVISRNKYRGKAKKAMGQATIDAALDLSVPSAVTQGNRNIGQIIDYHRGEQQTTCLAILALNSFSRPVEVAGIETLFSAIPSLD